MAAAYDLGEVTMEDWEASGRMEQFRKSHPEKFPFVIFISVFVALAVMYGILVGVDAIVYYTSRSRIILETGDRVEAQIDSTRFTHSEDNDRYYVRVNYTYNGMTYNSMPLPTMHPKEYDEYKTLVHDNMVPISVNPENPAEIYVVMMDYYSMGSLKYGLIFLGMYAVTFLFMIGIYRSWKIDNEAYTHFQVPPSEVHAILREWQKKAEENDPDFAKRTEDKKKLSDSIARNVMLGILTLGACIALALFALNSLGSTFVMLNSKPVQAQVLDVKENTHAAVYAVTLTYTSGGETVSGQLVEMKQSPSVGQTLTVYIDQSDIHKVYETKPEPDRLFYLYGGGCLVTGLLTLLFVILAVRSSIRYVRR